MKEKLKEAVVLEILRMSTEDGPGIRTTVFFKGCSLHCTWCHNPESLSSKPQTQWVGSRCIGCRLCLETCPRGALSDDGKGIRIDRTICEGCGKCVEECPSTAMELMGRKWTVAALADEVTKDKVYFGKSGGGVTASGGEATMQADFVAEFFKVLHERGVRTALDTCGQCAQKALEAILPHADLVLYDLKEIDSKRHKAFTGTGNERILENLQFVADYVKNASIRKELWIRTPIIPGATDRAENIRGLGSFIAAHLHSAVKRWELCSFNNLCRDKYTRLSMSWDFADAELMTKEEMARLADAAKKSGVDPKIVHTSGATRLTDKAAEPKSPRLQPRGC